MKACNARPQVFWPVSTSGECNINVSFMTELPVLTTARESVKKILAEIESVTCVHFNYIPLSQDSEITVDMQFLNSSYFGVESLKYRPSLMLDIREFNISAKNPHWKSSVLHEFCHALGMDHEHQHPNRDSHLNLDAEAITSLDQYNFVEVATQNVFSLFDYDSIMMYRVKREYTTSKVFEYKKPLQLSIGDKAFLSSIYPTFTKDGIHIIFHCAICNEERNACLGILNEPIDFKLACHRCTCYKCYKIPTISTKLKFQNCKYRVFVIDENCEERTIEGSLSVTLDTTGWIHHMYIEVNAEPLQKK